MPKNRQAGWNDLSARRTGHCGAQLRAEILMLKDLATLKIGQQDDRVVNFTRVNLENVLIENDKISLFATS